VRVYILVKSDDPNKSDDANELLGSVSIDAKDGVRWFCNGCGALVPLRGRLLPTVFARATERLLEHLQDEHAR
jgi:hypothetical protein